MTRESSKFKVRSSKGRAALVAVAALVGLASLVAAQQFPRFRAGVDVVEMDVSVWDKDHKPIRGLKAEDFTVFEDGKPQKIVAFSEEYTPPPPPPSAPWMRDVPKDVESNDVADKQLVVIVMDDANLSDMGFINPRPFKAAQAAARAVIQSLRDDDLASVILVNDNFKGQTFTSDRSKLLKAIEGFTVGPAYNVPAPQGGRGSGGQSSGRLLYDCQPMWYATDALRSAVEALSSIPHRRKTVFFISNGPDAPVMDTVPGSDKRRECIGKAQSNTEELLRQAQRANVNVTSVNPGGPPAADRTAYRFAVAENTGGRVTAASDDDVSEVVRVFDDAHAYYLIGYELTDRKGDGKFHRIDVKVNRPGAEVHNRKTRYDAPPPVSNPAKLLSPTDEAVGEYLPSGEIRATASVAPFRTPDGARVLVGITGQLPSLASVPARDHIDLLARAFTPDGRAVGANQQLETVVLTAGARFELAAHLDLTPGRYSLRMALHSAAADKTGSVYADVTIPDFTKDPLSLSGAMLTSSAGSSARGDVLSSLIPTAERMFAIDDRIQAFLRIYQGGSNPPANVTMHVKIVDEHNAAVSDRAEAIPAGAFAGDRQADYFVRLPLSTLKPGEYWLAIEAVAGKLNARRDLRFAVR